MKWGDVPAWFALAIAAAALLVSWKVRQDGRRSVEAAARSARAAEAALEHQRREARERRTLEATPELRITLRETDSDQATLNVHLAGPDHLGQLDSVTVTVVDDDMEHAELNTQASFLEGLPPIVWGPFQFAIPPRDVPDQSGRSVGPFELMVGRGRPFEMWRVGPRADRTGLTRGEWDERYRGHPVRLRVVCRRGEDEWILAREVPNPSGPQVF